MRYKVFPILRYGNFPLDITSLYFPPYLIFINFLPKWILYRIPFTLILNRGLDVRKIRNLPLKLILRRLQPPSRLFRLIRLRLRLLRRCFRRVRLRL